MRRIGTIGANGVREMRMRFHEGGNSMTAKSSLKGGQSVGQHMEDCIKACLSCAHICNRCGDDMVGMSHHADHDLMARCIRLCRDCADICLLAAQWMGRNSAFSMRICALCAELCELCAGVCEEHAPHHPLCGDCAKECRRCAELCHKMVVETVPDASGRTS
jgi:hypothetical protein